MVSFRNSLFLFSCDNLSVVQMGSCAGKPQKKESDVQSGSNQRNSQEPKPKPSKNESDVHPDSSQRHSQESKAMSLFAPNDIRTQALLMNMEAEAHKHHHPLPDSHHHHHDFSLGAQHHHHHGGW
ncbi:hypothetical protein QR680_013738 [Steinernema hermaphroditum]|uniref:Uncharacterized protein n=1 Tax=Steinernema hermaphroditum TaxID=289476 RepID=A0AA39M2V6_9BILA|nr:hypothetical protein QR680_013738 [Steinernema hermaphroditum]